MTSPEVVAAMAEVSRAFNALSKARTRVSRCTLPKSLEAARATAREAETAYRIASDARDLAVELDRARRTQAGDPLGAHWAADRTGPALDLAGALGKCKP